MIDKLKRIAVTLMSIEFKLSLVLGLALLSSSQVMAHNKVVVIPLVDDAASKFGLIRLVPEAPPSTNYDINSLTVLDSFTGLEWQRGTDSIRRTYGEAIDYCSSSLLDSKKDWRLPTYSELQSLVNFGRYNPAIDSTAFPGVKLGTSESREYYWSLTMNSGSINRQAYRVSFLDGRGRLGDWSDVSYNNAKSYVRCVR